MRIDIGCCVEIAVSQPSLNVFHGDLALEQQAGASVPEFVESDFSQVILLQNKGKMLGHIVRFLGLANVVHIHIVALMIRSAAELFTIFLMLFHAEQELSKLRDQG